MDFLLDLWNQIAGSNLVEPTTSIAVAFIIIFIGLPILCLYVGVKVFIWLATKIRDWWNEKP